MSKKLEKLLAQAKAIEAQIEAEKATKKAMAQVVKVTEKVLAKHPDLASLNAAEFETKLDEFFLGLVKA